MTDEAFETDDVIDIGDLPEMPEAADDRGVEDAFDYATAFKFAFVGIGQGGSRIAETFYRVGYRSVCAINTAVNDLASIRIPAVNKLDLGGGGAGKDPSLGAAAIEGRDEDVYDLYKRCLGDNIDYAILCLGAGGGTGAGAWPKAHEVLKQYLSETKRPVRIGAIAALPMNGEGQQPAKNAVDTAGKMGKADLSPLIVVDNERIAQLFKLTLGSRWSTANGQICNLFHLFNRIAAQDAPAGGTSFDSMDLAKLLDSGIVAFGATTVKDYAVAADVSRTMRQQLKANVLAAADLSKGDGAGCIFICGREIYNSLDASILDHGFESLNRILGPDSTVYRGIYQGNNNDLRCYTMIGGLDLPQERLQELTKKAGR
jgi:cell division GTPase FtsZ